MPRPSLGPTSIAMATHPAFADIDDYIAAAPAVSQPILEEIRKRIRERVPEARETIGYGMPAFRLGRIFIYFAAFQKHIGIYPPVTQDQELIAALGPFRNDKGNLRFPLQRPLPYELIGRVAAALAREHAAEVP